MPAAALRAGPCTPNACGRPLHQQAKCLRKAGPQPALGARSPRPKRAPWAKPIEHTSLSASRWELDQSMAGMRTNSVAAPSWHSHCWRQVGDLLGPARALACHRRRRRRASVGDLAPSSPARRATRDGPCHDPRQCPSPGRRQRGGRQGRAHVMPCCPPGSTSDPPALGRAPGCAGAAGWPCVF